MTVAVFTSIRRSGCERCESVSACVDDPGRRDKHRRVGTEQQQRGEIDDEGRRHQWPSPSPVPAAARELRSESPARIRPEKFEGPVRLRPAREPKEHSGSDRDSRKHDDRGKPRTRPHSGSFGEEFEESIHRGLMKQCPDQAGVAAQLVAGECIRQIWPNGEPGAPCSLSAHAAPGNVRGPDPGAKMYRVWFTYASRVYFSCLVHSHSWRDVPMRQLWSAGAACLAMLFGAVSAPGAAYARGKVRSDEAADVDRHGDADRLGESLRARADEGARAAAAGPVGRRSGGPDRPGEQRLERGVAAAGRGHPRRGIRRTRRQQADLGQVGGDDRARASPSTSAPTARRSRGRSRRGRRRGGLMAARASVRRPGRPATGDIRAAASLVEDGVNVDMDRLRPAEQHRRRPEGGADAAVGARHLRLRQSTFLAARSDVAGVQAARRPASVPAARTDSSSSSSPTSSASSSCWAAATATAAPSTPTAASKSARSAGTTTIRCSTATAVATLGRRHVRRRHARLQRGVLVRQRRSAAHRAAADHRAIHTRRHGDDAVRSDD